MEKAIKIYNWIHTVRAKDSKCVCVAKGPKIGAPASPPPTSTVVYLSQREQYKRDIKSGHWVLETVQYQQKKDDWLVIT